LIQQSIDHIILLFYQSTTLDPNWYKAWRSYAMINSKAQIKKIEDLKKNLEFGILWFIEVIGILLKLIKKNTISIFFHKA